MKQCWILKTVLFWPLFSIAAAPLFHPFFRVEGHLPAEAKDRLTQKLQDRTQELQLQFKYLRPPEKLILTITDSLNLSVYRAGELYLPYRFSSLTQPLNEFQEQGLIYPWWDYYLGMAYFDHNMIFAKGESASWDSFQETHDLLKERYLQWAYIAEDNHLRSTMTPREISAIYGENFHQNSEAARRKSQALEDKILERNKSPRIRYIDAYVFELQAYFLNLFSDLLVAILYQDPHKISSVLETTGFPPYVAEAPYRSFKVIEGLNFDKDPLAYKYSHFFAPIRAELWKEITQNHRSKEAQLRSLESIYIRSRVIFKDVLMKLDQKFATSGFSPLGDSAQEFLAALKLNRAQLLKQLRMGFCEENLRTDEN